ncbi:hypothetical protein [Bacillus cereus]|uniref:hypothetical protein n=1 Tax=Bacillus cereus TaxID=1396 RepID=UPI002D783713|nr:hypothetical protein [Bacillus cereus]
MQTVINEKGYHIIYTIISPLGEKYKPKEIQLYATSEEEAVQTIEFEIRRRMGTKYQIEVTCLNIDLGNPCQMTLF